LSSIVVLNGPPGVGKTSVARHLAEVDSTTVCISGDALRGFAPDDPAAARALLGAGSTYRIGAILAGSYIGLGARCVVFDYVFQRPANVELFRQCAPEGVPLHIVTLWAPLATIVRRDMNRSNGSPVGARVESSVRAMESCLSELGVVVDTHARTVQEVARQIRELVVDEL
jgi:chloramphenicol 3-O-phosphotransferase